MLLYQLMLFWNHINLSINEMYWNISCNTTLYLNISKKLLSLNLIVTSLIDTSPTTVISRERLHELDIYNVFLTPAHDWIHDCIQDWTWEWDLSLNTSTVWPNRCRGIVAMLSGGMVGRFCKLIRGERKKLEKLEWRIKALLPCFKIFL